MEGNTATRKGPDEKTAHVNQRIFDAYKRPLPTTACRVKSIEDKMNTLNQSYKFIADFNAHRAVGTGRGDWHSLTTEERKQIRLVFCNAMQMSGELIQAIL